MISGLNPNERYAYRVRRSVPSDTPQARMNWLLALAMWRDGKDTSEIAKEFEVSESFIYNFMPRSKAQRAGQ